MDYFLHTRTDVGKEREGNEDLSYVGARADGVQLLIVCDGMGGHEGGEIASKLACEVILNHLEAADRSDPVRAIEEALYRANQAVLQAAGSPGGKDMGTTAVVAWVDDQKLWYGWVGDSRLYHLRGSHVVGRTVDHTRVQVMVEVGLLRPEDVKGHPEGHILMQALGGGPSAQQAFAPAVQREPELLEKGDVVLLCTDGLHDLVDDAELVLTVSGREARDAGAALVQAALDAGGYDNVTVALLVVGQSQIPMLDIDSEQDLRGRLKHSGPTLAPKAPSKSEPSGPPLFAGLVFGTVAGILLGWWIHTLLV